MANAKRRLSFVKRADSVIVQAEIDAAGVGFDSPAGSAQRLPEWFVIGFGFEVPEGDIERADDIGDGATVAAFEGEIGHALPQAHDAARVAPEEQVLRHGMEIPPCCDGLPSETPVSPSSVSRKTASAAY